MVVHLINTQLISMLGGLPSKRIISLKWTWLAHLMFVVTIGLFTGVVSAGEDKVVFADARGKATTPSFSTSASNELLVAFVSSDGPSGGGQSVTVSGAGLTWTLIRRTNTQAGTAEVWQAMAPTPLTNVTVTSTQARTTYDQSLTVVAFTGAAGVGASAGASAISGASRVSLVTTAANSLVYAVGNDWDKAVARSLGTGQSLVHQWVDTGSGDTFWSQRMTDAVAAVGTTVTLNTTAPTTGRWNFTAVELVVQ